MAGKAKKSYQCNACGAVLGKWAGQCPECEAWNSVEEATAQVAEALRTVGFSGAAAQVKRMSDVELEQFPRITTGLSELDRVLGGGLVPGSVALIGGDPGVGKSTALLQVCCTLKGVKALYVSGEESLPQIAMRAKRLGLPAQELLLLAETQVEGICAVAAQEKPTVMVIDSIQTMQVAGIDSAPGGVSQVRESAAYLTRFAKQSGVAIFLVGHVTKSGGLAGPRVLEHIIDVVCYFEGGSDSRYRMMRAIKNRYGAVNELGIFAMTESGLKEVKNPSAIFLSRDKGPMSGSAVMVVWEGSRPLLVEIQALVDTCYSEHPRRLAVGLDQNRLTMLLAVLHRHGGVSTFDKDVFINVVGGVKVEETSADLALMLAILSSLQDRPLPSDMVIFGEIGLAGEIRPVPNGQERLREAVKHGFNQAIVPKANAPRTGIAGMEVHGVQKLAEAMAILGR
ncbi:MAG: DNA repair protein RadA [Proteobacteria bacterium]|nr:DNA repair protein RadA [Desulfobulbaceae bacterium]MBU4153244.1 DNA repair protein RadA [Pseudomonadota bacterium]MDP2106032.1 DNA repair protein RadA [Desulfobulbaceae bacterium]